MSVSLVYGMCHWTLKKSFRHLWTLFFFSSTNMLRFRQTYVGRMSTHFLSFWLLGKVSFIHKQRAFSQFSLLVLVVCKAQISIAPIPQFLSFMKTPWRCLGSSHSKSLTSSSVLLHHCGQLSFYFLPLQASCYNYRECSVVTSYGALISGHCKFKPNWNAMYKTLDEECFNDLF